jgi:aryl-alcohol dehydrogenase-like predicted oxidoreductase
VTTTRTLGRSGITVSAIGMGCWAIGGPLWGEDRQPFGWGDVDDDESIHTLFDTASNYGAGRSERARRGRRGTA